MNLPTNYLSDFINSLIQHSFSFALYRLPWADACHLVWQTQGEAERLTDIHSLNGRRGFVIAPFQLSETCPLLLIRPDITACGWEEITQITKNIQIPVNGVTNPNKQDDSWEQPYKEEQARYEAAFERFILPLREQQFQKLVLSRASSVHLGPTFLPLQAFVRACNSYPRMMIYLCHTPASGTWIGSTPEILLSGQGKEWHTVALAGTMSLQNGDLPSEWSFKNQKEQAYVADYIRQIVQRYGSRWAEDGPYTARAAQLVHLKTDFHFVLKQPGRLGDLLDELHPTPAVCGLPKKEAFHFITAKEGYNRSYYSGFIGCLNPDSHTDLYVNLRCMRLTSTLAKLYAGGGILASSEIKAEWEETQEKMKTMRHIIDP